MLLLATLLNFTFIFPGGNDGALASAIQEQLGTPVAILANGRRQWPKVQIEEQQEPKQSRIVLANALGSTPIWEEGAGICTKAWPEYFYRRDMISSYESAIKSKGKVVWSSKGDKVSVSTEGGPAPLGDLMIQEITGSGVSWHWFFEQAYVQVRCKDLSRAAYLKLLAEAIGATVQKVKQGVYLDLDLKVYRSRTMALADERFAALKDPGGEKYDFLILSIGLQAVSDSDLSKLMDKPTNLATFDLTRDGAFQKAAWQRFLAQYPANPQRAATSVITKLRESIDPNKPVRLILYSRGLAGCRFQAKDGGTVVL